jgi:hypothetical protein
MTKKPADHLALKPTATMTHAARPMMETRTRVMLHVPWKMTPRNKNMRRTRPARRKLEEKRNEKSDRPSDLYVLFLAIQVAYWRDASKFGLSRQHGITEYHKEATNDAQVSEEEIHVKNKTITNPLDNHNAKKTTDSVFGVSFGYDSTGTD